MRLAQLQGYAAKTMLPEALPEEEQYSPERAVGSSDVVLRGKAELGGGGVDPSGGAFEFEEGADGGFVEDGVPGVSGRWRVVRYFS